MTVLEALGVALAGGSVGAVLTWMLGVPTQVKDHDRKAGETDEALGQWVSDECVRLERELNAHSNASVAKGQGTSGSYLTGIAHIKESFLHLYRDREREAKQTLTALSDAEDLRHRFWRWITRRGPLRQLTTPGAAQPVLDGWRAEVDVSGVGKAPVSDPTRRPLSWAVDKYGETVPGNE